jgi:aryl-alcohol dehydrogenase-like predicted oxidoreductase
MEYRRLGNSGLEVSVVGLGTNNFGGRMDFEQTEKVVRHAVEVDINLLDTSNSYGNGLSEEYIGRSIKGIRDKLLLATKVATPQGGPNQGGASRKHILDQVEKSLTRLGTDYIDLYQMHYPDPNTPIEETLRTLDDLVRQGKVRYIGCSNYAAWQVAQAVETSRNLHTEPFVSAQPEYSMLNRDVEAELVPVCQAYGLSLLPYYPLASGFLTGKYRRGQDAPEGTRLAGGSRRAQNTLTDANFDVLEGLEAFAAGREHSMVELAFAWLLTNPVVGSVIAGATKTEQLDANAKAADWHLTPDEMQEIDGILKGGG